MKPGDGDNGIVLQKGGIKTNALFNLREENSTTFELFLNRHPEQKIDYKTGVGIKDMVRNDTDFVYRTVNKRLSMEFDWKRRRVNIRDVDVEFEGKRYKHLTFDTVPIEDHSAFDQVREAWHTYDKKNKHNLKLTEDFLIFEKLRTAKGSLPSAKSKYIRKQDGAIGRLKQDITRAYQQRLAGFDAIRIKYKLKHGIFMESLNACGIPCKISDIDNGKKAAFETNNSPDTDDVIEALLKLKSDFYPEIKIELFLPEGTMEKLPKSSEKLAA